MSEPSLVDGFASPSDSYGQVPFWWWTGERLVPERLAWQLDQLRAGGVHCAVISYSHKPDGSIDPGDPPVLSEEWWQLLEGVLRACKQRGMTLGFQDYSILGPRLKALGVRDSSLRGQELREFKARLRAGESCTLDIPGESTILEAVAFPILSDLPVIDGAIALSALAAGCDICLPTGIAEALVSVVYVVETPFNPLHERSGEAVIADWYDEFLRRCPGYLGTVLRISFQDELNFELKFPAWSRQLAGEFEDKKGYPLIGNLSHLWNDLSDDSVRIRLDFHDVAQAILERNYFRPIYEWHEARGLLFGHDNIGRGSAGIGGRHYGDYFQSMKWYSAPGSDDPNLRGPRNSIGIRVSASIAHLYDRPRVWAECFHSSGWGVRPDELVAGVNAVLAAGATLINLHGLYYSTRGGWWEWAPPDFHFRQPWWRHARSFNDYVKRACFLLSQGSPGAEVAVLYPSTTIVGALGCSRRYSSPRQLSLSEAQRSDPADRTSEAEDLAADIVEHLVASGCEAEFIDDPSLLAASAHDGELHVSRSRFKAVVVAQASAIRMQSLRVLQSFVSAGGTVCFVGCLPRASDLNGDNDPEVRGIVHALLGSTSEDTACEKHHAGEGRVLFIPDWRLGHAIDVHPTHKRHCLIAGSPLVVASRRHAVGRILFLFNPSNESAASTLRLSLPGRVQRWSLWTGLREELRAADGDGATIGMELGPGEAQVLVVGDPPPAPAVTASDVETIFRIDPPRWDFKVIPTLDNRYGDFELPVASPLVLPQARRFFWREEHASQEAATWQVQTLDETAWREAVAGYGPKAWVLGPMPAAASRLALEALAAANGSFDPSHEMVIEGCSYRWLSYEISETFGILDDPFMRDWASGPHGLKNRIPDEIFDLYSGTPGDSWIIATHLAVSVPGRKTLVAGSRSVHEVWLGGSRVLQPSEELPPGRLPPWNLPHYDSPVRKASVEITQDSVPLLVRILQPEGQRARAYVALEDDLPGKVDDGGRPPSVRWFPGSGSWWFQDRGGSTHVTTWLRCKAPPGTRRVTARIRGDATAWLGGSLLEKQSTNDGRTEWLVNPSCDVASTLALRIVGAAGRVGGAVLDSGIEFTCGMGSTQLGDWADQGLLHFPGVCRYETTFEMLAEQVARATAIRLDDVRVSAEVFLNGYSLGVIFGRSGQLPLGSAARPGRNELAIEVANTLASRYVDGPPTPYASREDASSGLLGPVEIVGPSIRQPTVGIKDLRSR